MSRTYDLPEPHILVVGHQRDALPLLDAGFYGPFESVEQAQEYARAFRSLKGLPSANTVPTPEENEEWTDAEWTFGIFRLKREHNVEEIMTGQPDEHYERLAQREDSSHGK